MRTLILGGTGMLGRAVTAAARRRGFPALALSHSQADITDRERLLYWVREFRPELIVNAAAYTKVDLCERERETAFAVNGTAVANLTAAAAAAGSGGDGGAVLLQVSTDYVFDGIAGTGSVPYKEDDPTGPLSVYGESKLLGERLAREYGRALVVRTSWLFGPGGPNFVATILRLLHEQKPDQPLRVVDDQRGGPTYTPYLAHALLDLAPLVRDGFGGLGGLGGLGGVIHYQNREPVTWYGFASEIARLTTGTVDASGAPRIVPVPTAEFPRPAVRPAWSVLDVHRFEKAVGRRVEPWEMGLSEYLH